MVKKTRSIPSDIDQLMLDVLTAETEDVPRGIVQISHGMCENKERYLPLMEFLAAGGFHSIIHDHRGHGKSVADQKDLGFFYGGGGSALVEDLHQITEYAKTQWPGLPLILLGHSMGSMVARNFIKDYDEEIAVLIVCGSPSKNPMLHVGKAIARVQKSLQGGRHKSHLLEALSFAGYLTRFPGEKSRFAWTCSDPEVVGEYDSSPYCGFTFTVDAYEGLFDLMEETYNTKKWKCQNPDLPILFIGGEEDPCIGSGEKFVQAMKHLKGRGYRHVTGKRYSHMRHEILNECGKAEVFQNILTYMNKYLL